MAYDSFERALSISRQVGDTRSSAAALLGLGICSNTEDAFSHLFSAWKTCNQSGNVTLSIEVALKLAQTYVRKAIGLDQITSLLMDGISSVNGGSKNRLRDKDALKEARQWFNCARDLATKFPSGNLQYHIALQETEVLRLENRPKEALGVLLLVLKKTSNSFEIANCHAGLAGIYFHDLNDPASAMQHFEKAVTASETINIQLPSAEYRINNRNNMAGLYMWMAECALVLGKKQTAFATLERAKNKELQRLWSFRHTDLLSAPTLTQLHDSLKGRSTAIVEFMPTTTKLYAFIISPGLSPDEEILAFEKIPINKLANWYSRIIRAYSSLDSPDSVIDPEIWLTEVDTVCKEVGHELLDSIHDLLSKINVKDVLFIPHSILHAIPLHACRLKDGSDWTDSYQVSYSPSASLLLKTWRNPDPPRHNFIGFADSMGDLPMARAEILTSRVGFSGEVSILIGEKASKEEALRRLAQNDWIHFACHADMVFGDTTASGIFLGSSENDEDNFLTLHEINQRVSLVKGSVVILSACETGMIMPYLSDEYISLAAGFIPAGASIIISTYWKVNDVCAFLILNRFYEELRTANQHLAEALRKASLWVRDINEKEVYEFLSATAHKLPREYHDSFKPLIEQFEQCETSCRPFHHVADWGAFQLVGWGRKQITVDD